jgi:uncharacterized protein (DUF1330 family)
MIRHLVLFSARDSRDLDRIEANLARLATISHVRHLEVARNAKVDSLSNEIDVVVCAEFDDFAHLAAFKEDPIYAAVTKVVRPLRALRIVADIEVREG